MGKRVDVAVVGAGPGGLEAAITVGEAGLRVAVIDRYPQAGGQYFKQMPEPFSASRRTDHQKKAEALFERFARSKASLLADTIVWNVIPVTEGIGWQLMLYGPEAPLALQADALILATGAYDRTIAFPGWTLPGVITAGAAQTLVKSQRVLPGQRVLLSGAGPLQLAVAAQLVQAGATLVGVLEGARLGVGSLRCLPAMWGQWARMREGADYWWTLIRAGVPYRTGWSVIEACGDGRVRQARIARLDNDWRPVPGSEQSVAVDSLVIGYGFIPSTELCRLLGCQLDYDPGLGGHIPRRDETMQTTLPGVYAVGDGAGIGGADLAAVEGRIAGAAVAQQLSGLDEAAARAAIARQQPSLARERRFARLLGDLFTPAPALYELATDETVVCRCEEVTRGEIREAIDCGCQSVTWVKRMTRAGMGLCQGRICGHLVARSIAEKTGQDPGHLLPDTVRPPVKPVPLEILAERGEK